MISNSNDTRIVRGNRAKRRGTALLLALLGALALASNAQAQATVGLGTAGRFAVLAGSTVTNTGPSVITGAVGVSPLAAVVGFPPGVVNDGSIHAADAVAAQAQSDLTVAYNDAAGRACDDDLTGMDLGGMTLTSGVYCFQTTAQLTGTVTLNGQGNANSVFIFQVGSSLTTASGSRVRLINGAQACNVFWQVGITATLGTTTRFKGTVMALTSIVSTTNVRVQGRLLASNAETTLDTNTISRSTCDSAGPTVTIGGAPGDGIPGNPVVVGNTRCIATDFRLRIRARDRSTVETIRVFLDGRLIKQKNSGGQLFVWIRAERLSSSRHTIRVVATDQLGNERVQIRRFRRCDRAVLPELTGRLTR